MSEDETSTSFEALRASVSRVRGAGARFAERLQKTAETYRGEDRLARLVARAKDAQDQLRQQARRVLRDIEHRRAQIANSLETQTAPLMAHAAKRLNIATDAGLKQLRERVAECERRLGVEAHLALEKARG